MLYLTQLTGMILSTLINGVVGGDCPPELNDLEFDPPKLVVQYGDSVSASCRSFSKYTDLSWSVPVGKVWNPVNQTVTWNTDSLTDWDIQPVCYMILDGVQCNKPLPLTLYKLPDRVSISTVNHTGPMVEGSEYKLQCDIHNVAPLHLLTVSWYKGLDLMNSISFSDLFQKNPLTQSTTLYILPSEEDDGVLYRCEAELNLGPEGPQPPPTVISDPLNITVTPQANNCTDLVLDPPEVVVQYGEPVSVSCRSLSNYTDLNWRVPLGNVLNTENQTVTWNTDDLTDWEVEPVCYNTLDDVQCSKALPLIVYKIPDQVSISVVDHSGPMTAGKKYELQCDIENFAPVNVLAVFWYKGETLIKNRGFSDLPTKTPSNKTVTLKISASKDDYDAEYRCEAKLKLGARGPQPPPIVSSNTLSMPVHYKPEITCLDWSPMINTTLSLYPYNVMGNPSPVITWYRDRSPVSSDTRLGRYDSGLYSVDASNMMGTSHCETKITVEYAPTFDCPATHTGIEHDSFFDKCLVRASPAANITWEKDGETVTPLHNLTREDSGSYVIRAVNEHGAERHSLIINVLYGPEIRIIMSSKDVKENENVSLTCTAMGFPEPDVKWSFHNHDKSFGSQQTTLTIHKALHADAGEYKCTATNDLRSSTETVVLTVQSSCPITIQPAKLVVEINATATAVCSTTTTHNGMGWEAAQGGVSKVKDVRSITWNVENIKYWEAQPICYILTSKLCQSILPVTVYKRPDRVSISFETHTEPMIEGRRYELKCEIQNVAPVNLLLVNWYKGQQLVNTDSFSDENKYPADKSAALQISPQGGDDGVQYRCEAELELGPEGPQPPPRVTSEPLSLTVHYKPEITCLDWSPMINTTLSLYPYNVMGNPSPVITWYRDRSPVSSDTRLGRYDSGLYSVDASNMMGTSHCETKITVEYAPTFDCPATHTGIEHDSFFDKCLVRASPAANITWEKDGETVTPLHNLTREDSGSYVIRAVNEHGAERHSLIINVLYGPDIQQGNLSEVVKVGKNVSLRCSAEGNPEPHMSWSFQSQTKATGRRQTTLNISKAESADAGEYTCTATNTLGSKTSTVSLAVQESNIQKIIFLGLFLALLIIIIICFIYKYVARKRSGKYTVQTNGDVSMKLLK